MMRLILALCLGLAALAPARAAEGAADSGPSVMVVTQAPRKGTLDQPLTAYGVAQAASAGSGSVASLHAAEVVELRVVQGQIVRRGEPLLDLGSDPAAALAYSQAQSDLDIAKAELARTRKMVTEQLATASQLDQAAKAVRDAEATLKAREREGGGKPLETVPAPFDGVVTNVAVANGDHVQPGTALVGLARGDKIVALLGIAPDERSRVKPGQAVQISDLDSPAASIDARIVSVGGMADPKTGMISLVAAPSVAAPGNSGSGEPAAGMLFPGAHLRARIQGTPVEGWIVARQAVLSDEKGPYLYQIADGKAVRVAVEIRGEGEEDLAVSGPIDPARKIVIAGNYQLTDGMAVREQAEAGAPADENAPSEHVATGQPKDPPEGKPQ